MTINTDYKDRTGNADYARQLAVYQNLKNLPATEPPSNKPNLSDLEVKLGER